MNIDWNLVANVVSVVGTVGGLLFVWWQVRQIREVNAYGLLRDEVKRWRPGVGARQWTQSRVTPPPTPARPTPTPSFPPTTPLRPRSP